MLCSSFICLMLGNDSNEVQTPCSKNSMWRKCEHRKVKKYSVSMMGTNCQILLFWRCCNACAMPSAYNPLTKWSILYVYSIYTWSILHCVYLVYTWCIPLVYIGCILLVVVIWNVRVYKNTCKCKKIVYYALISVLKPNKNLVIANDVYTGATVPHLIPVISGDSCITAIPVEEIVRLCFHFDCGYDCISFVGIFPNQYEKD